MPFMRNGHRDYQAEKAWDHKHKGGKRLRDRAARNKARAMVASKLGKKPTQIKGDVGHVKAISKGGLSKLYNLKVQSAKANRSFSRNANGSMKNEKSKKGY